MPSSRAARLTLSLSLLLTCINALPQASTSNGQKEQPAPMCGHPRGTDSYFQPGLTLTNICLTTHTYITFDLHCSSVSVDAASLSQSLDQFQKYASSLVELSHDYYATHPTAMTHCVPKEGPAAGPGDSANPIDRGARDIGPSSGTFAVDLEPKTCTAVSLVPAANDAQALTPAIIVDFLGTLESLAGVDKPLQCRFELKEPVDQKTIASGCIAAAEGYVAAKGYTCPKEAMSIP